MIKSLKYLFCTSILIGTSFNSYSGENDFATDIDAIFCGFSTGLQVGNSSTIGTLQTLKTANLQFAAIPVGSIITVNKQDYLSKNSVAASAFAGYGYNFNSVFFGVEAFLKGAQQRMVLNALNSFETDTAIANIQSFSTTKLKALEYGVDFRPGFLLSAQSLLYVRAGVAFNNLTLTSRNDVQGIDIGVASGTNVFFQRNTKKLIGLRFGFGLEQQFSECWTVRVDYVNTNYRRVGISDVLVTTNLPAPLVGTATFTNDVQARVINNTVSFGLTYYW
jgi:opacity protein-like surface antigen